MKTRQGTITAHRRWWTIVALAMVTYDNRLANRWWRRCWQWIATSAVIGNDLDHNELKPITAVAQNTVLHYQQRGSTYFRHNIEYNKTVYIRMITKNVSLFRIHFIWWNYFKIYQKLLGTVTKHSLENGKEKKNAIFEG